MGEARAAWRHSDTVNESLTTLAERLPDREFYIFYNRGKRESLTALNLYTLAGRFSSRLRRHGFQSRDIIANTLPNSPERVVTDLGILLAGCITFNAQHLLSDGSDLYMLVRKSGCMGIILSNNEGCPTWNLLNGFISGDMSEFATSINLVQAPNLKSSIVVSRKNIGSKRPLLDDLRLCNEEIYVREVNSADIGVIFSTSGSTGYSKLVPKTHSEIVNNLLQRESPLSQDRENFVMYNDRLLGWVGGFSAFSIMAAVPKVLRDNFLLDESTVNQDFWEAVTKERCTFAVMVPLEAEKRIEYIINAQGSPPRKCQSIVVIGQPVTKVQIKNFFKISEKIFIGYGSTECVDVSGLFVQEETYESYNCGKPSERTKVRVVNVNGELSPPKQIGTIHIKSTVMSAGYFNKVEDPDPDTIRAFTPDGWLNMEDYGYIDEEGNLFVLGRNKDIINYGASVIYPGWLEDQIVEHPEVMQACVVPVSDPVLHSNICACVKILSNSKLNDRELKFYCDKIFLPNVNSSLTPRPAFFLLFKEDYPELRTGKSDRQKLKFIAEEKFGYNSRLTTN
ncbi:hypothetical protein Btru_009274 [Bulinus truncatus]|nr:hypothetical protein Btru_009274 [Bulinus truncatus]